MWFLWWLYWLKLDNSTTKPQTEERKTQKDRSNSWENTSTTHKMAICCRKGGFKQKMAVELGWNMWNSQRADSFSFWPFQPPSSGLNWQTFCWTLRRILSCKYSAQEAGQVTGNAFLNQKLLQVRKREGLLSSTRLICPCQCAPKVCVCASPRLFDQRRISSWHMMVLMMVSHPPLICHVCEEELHHYVTWK